MAITSVRLPDATKQAVDELAQREGKTPHAFMLEAIELKVELSRQRQAFLEEGRIALREVQTGSPTIGLDEMAAWMRARVRGEDMPPPEGA